MSRVTLALPEISISPFALHQWPWLWSFKLNPFHNKMYCKDIWFTTEANGKVTSLLYTKQFSILGYYWPLYLLFQTVDRGKNLPITIQKTILYNGHYPASLFYIFIFSIQLTGNKTYQWLDSNLGSLLPAATALPTVPQILRYTK